MEFNSGLKELTTNKQRAKLLPNWEECGPYPVFAIYTLAFALPTEEKALKNLSHGSRRMPVGTMKTECTEQYITTTIHNHNTKNS
jgi:hypothetical protein